MNFFQRLTLAFSAFFSILGSAELADRFLASKKTATALPPSPGADTESGSGSASGTAQADGQKELPHRDALHLLAILQREGRLVDFLQEDMGGYSDADVGAAARAVHAGCRKALAACVPLVPVIDKDEGSGVTVEADQANRSVNLTGNLSGKGPFKGILCHRGWKATAVNLPEASSSKDMSVIAPAEVEM